MPGQSSQSVCQQWESYISKKAVLVIEDELQIRQELQEVFAGEGYPVITARHGKEALRLLRDFKGELPGIIFLDLMMPIMDGQEFLIQLQKHPEHQRYSKIPVVIVTAGRSEVFGDYVAIIRKPPDIYQLTELAKRYAT